MNDEWISPKLIIGPGATGDYYYKRELIEQNIWKEIKKGNNILISAPRRVGKTSVMKSITNNPHEGYKLIFENIQGIDTEEVFYKTLYELILNCLSRFKTNRLKIENYFKQKEITGAVLDNIEIGSKKLDYVYEINNIIPQLDPEGEVVVLLIDELPEVIHSFYKSGNNPVAISILKNLRRWRQKDDYKMLKFIIAGSIGIHHVVNQVEGRSSDINDLLAIDCPALDTTEFKDYIDWATKEASISFEGKVTDYLKEKIQYFVPYFINLMLDQIDKEAAKNNKGQILKENIDKAFEKIVKDNSYFSDWKKRLKDYLKHEDFNFVNQVLIHIAHENIISIHDLYDKAVELEKTEDYMELIFDLEKDGYIYEGEKGYIFISPFLKAYWKRNNPIYKA